MFQWLKWFLPQLKKETSETCRNYRSSRSRCLFSAPSAEHKSSCICDKKKTIQTDEGNRVSSGFISLRWFSVSGVNIRRGWACFGGASCRGGNNESNIQLQSVQTHLCRQMFVCPPCVSRENNVSDKWLLNSVLAHKAAPLLATWLCFQPNGLWKKTFIL